jgi:hypothetical protein
MAQLNYERAARILTDAAYYGDEKSAEKWEITSKTIRNYRERLKTDPQLSALFQKFRQKFEAEWKPELARSIFVTVRKIAEMVEAVDTAHPCAEMLEALTGAVKALSEIAITTEVLNAGDADSSQASAKTGGAVA